MAVDRSKASITPKYVRELMKKGLAFLAIALLFFATAWAQTTISTGSISGTVTDPTGAAVAEAGVVVSSVDTGRTIHLTTNSSGAYDSGALSAGSYRVQISAKGFSTLNLKVEVRVGNTTNGNAQLQVGSEGQVIEVVGSAVQVNTEQPTVQGVLTSQQIENLPLGSRNFLDLAQLEPGVQIQDGGNFDPTKNGFSSISFGGRFGRTARIAVDGIDISDETVGTTTQNISASAINEFQLSQSTLDLSTDLTSSGAVNVVTKSGTNTYHGQAFYLFRDKSFLANFPGDLDTYYQRNHFGGSFGGAIVKDRLFFFLNGERIKQGQLVALAPPPPFDASGGPNAIPNSYPGGFKDTMTLAKLDWHIKPNMTAFYRFTYEWNADSRAFGATYQPFANKNNTPSQAAGWDFTTGNFSHSVRFGFVNFQNRIADAVLGNPGVYNPAGDIPVAIRIGPAGVTSRFGPSRLAPQATLQTNHQIKYDGSWLTGSHTIRYGFGYNRIRGGGFASFYGIAPEIRTSNSGAAATAAAGGPFPGGDQNPLNYFMTAILLGNGQGFFTETPAFGYAAGGQGDNRLSAYVGDSWKIKPNLTLTYGVRWSRDTGRQDSDLAPATCDQIDTNVIDPSLLPCTGNQLILDQFGEPNLGGRVHQPDFNFGPQVGFAWDPRHDGKTVIRGGTGIYYENAVFNNVLFDRPARLAQGLFFSTASPNCNNGTLALPTGTVTSVNGVDILTGICNHRVGEIMSSVADMEALFQQSTASVGAQANPIFIGANLANGPNSTGNGFIAPDYKTPMSVQINLGIQREIRPGLVLTADFLRNVGLHYLITHDTNHVGDSRFLNVTAAQNAIATTLSNCGVATIDDAINLCPSDPLATGNPYTPRPANISDFAGNGLDSGKFYLSGLPAAVFGLTPDTGAAFPGINPLVGENEMLFSTGRSTYTALQLKLVENLDNPFRGLRHASFQFSYALSRFNTMGRDQDFLPVAFDYRNPGRFYGPGSLDRTHQFSFGGFFDLPYGPRLSLAGHFFSPLANNLAVTNDANPGQNFLTDYIGDGAAGVIGNNPHEVPGTEIGQWGRSITPGNIGALISNYNNTVAGTILPAGQALINAGLITEDQLRNLGGVANSLATPPSNQFGMTWLKTFDLKFAWPIQVRERFHIEPSISFYNLFNFANFNSPTSLIGGTVGEISSCAFGTAASDCGGAPNSATGTPNSLAATNNLRIGTGTGAGISGSPRQMEFGLKLTF